MNIVELKNISADEIFKLFTHLEKFSDNDKKVFALSRIKNFFPNLTIDQEIVFYNILESNNKILLEEFINTYPNIEVNLDGDSNLKTSNNDGIRAKEKALQLSYEYLKNTDTKITSHEKQIIRARELTCLKNIDVDLKNYSVLKYKALKLFNIDNDIKKYENIDIIDMKSFLSKVFKYSLQNKSDVFLKYVLYYLDIIRLDEKSELSQKYLETIKNIL